MRVHVVFHDPPENPLGPVGHFEFAEIPRVGEYLVVSADPEETVYWRVALVLHTPERSECDAEVHVTTDTAEAALKKSLA